MHILLVEPDYYTRYPPLGLLKISAYHKSKGDTTKLVRGCRRPTKKPDRIYVTSLFTWSWEEVWRTVRHYKTLFPRAQVWLGGLYASLMPDHAALSGADHIYKGLFKETENLVPDYGLVPKWDGSIVFSSRGCLRRCPFCAVPKLEGPVNSVRYSIRDLIYPKHSRIIFWDNNILASPGWEAILNELKQLDMTIDFNQGLDARLITHRVAEELGTLRLSSGSTIKIRLGYDSLGSGSSVKKAIERLNAAGIRGRAIMVYTLYNYRDTPSDFMEKVLNVLEWGAVVYPMRYEPLDSAQKGSYVDPGWSEEQLEMVADARRVIGYGGAFPPHLGLRNKIRKAQSFGDAFHLEPLVVKAK